jgi:hypothetical protein
MRARVVAVVAVQAAVVADLTMWIVNIKLARNILVSSTRDCLQIPTGNRAPPSGGYGSCGRYRHGLYVQFLMLTRTCYALHPVPLETTNRPAE